MENKHYKIMVDLEKYETVFLEGNYVETRKATKHYKVYVNGNYISSFVAKSGDDAINKTKKAMKYGYLHNVEGEFSVREWVTVSTAF